jgi:hypothetical protein
MRIKISRNHSDVPIAATLSKLFEMVSRECASMAQIHSRVSPETEVIVTIGGSSDCEKWDVRPDALGFHAVASATRYDTDEDCIQGINGWLDVNENNEVVINVDAAVELCVEHAQHSRNELDDISFMISMMTTPIHELMHMIEFLERSGGRTPVEVFDEDKGELGLRAILNDEHAEDRVESIALSIAEDMHAHDAEIRNAATSVLETLSRTSTAKAMARI